MDGYAFLVEEFGVGMMADQVHLVPALNQVSGQSPVQPVHATVAVKTSGH